VNWRSKVFGGVVICNRQPTSVFLTLKSIWRFTAENAISRKRRLLLRDVSLHVCYAVPARNTPAEAVGKALQRLQAGEKCKPRVAHIKTKIFLDNFVEFRSGRSSL
jgi:hypothetical protein